MLLRYTLNWSNCPIPVFINAMFVELKDIFIEFRFEFVVTPDMPGHKDIKP